MSESYNNLEVGLSYSTVEFMNSLPESIGWEARANVNPTGLTVEQIEMGTMGSAFMDYMIKHKRERYFARSHRHEVMQDDPIAVFICERWIEEITSKPFKTYDLESEDENGQPQEIMADVWQTVERLNINELYNDIYQYLAMDGYCLSQFGIGEGGQPMAKCFGFFHSPPDYWKRINKQGTDEHNVIYEYYVNYIPMPNGFQYMGNYNIHAVEEWLSPIDPNFMHFYRKKWNNGVGRPRVQPIWASMTKLRKMAHADYRRALVFNLLEYPEDWAGEEILEPLIQAARRADETEGLAMPKRVNKMTGEVEDWPQLRERTWDEEGGSPRSDPSAGGSLLRHSEYARVLIALGYTETKLVGSQPGEVTGSKLDLTRDDEVDLREFNLFKQTIKQINFWLLQNGYFDACEPDSQMRVLSGDYDIMCHVEWEVFENMMAAAEMAEEQAEMDAGQQEQQARNSISPWVLRDVRDNSFIVGFRTNVDRPMTPLGSSTVKGAGVFGTDFLVQFHDTQGTYRYHFPTHQGAEQAWFEISDQSPGAYIWDRFRGDRYGPAYFSGKPTIGGTTASKVPYDIGGRTPVGRTEDYEKKSKEMRDYKKSKLGKSREPHRFPTKPASSHAVPMATTPMTYVPPALYNEAFEQSYGRANNLMKEYTGQGIGKDTWYKFKEYIDHFNEEHQPRFNSLDIGNPMSFDVKLRYPSNNDLGFVEEYACKREWKKIEAHAGDLYMYPNLGHAGKKHSVGTYNYYWDEKADMPVIERNVDDEAIKTLLAKWNITSSRILNNINKGLPVPMSTEYYCSIMNHKGKRYQMNFQDGQGNHKLKGIAIVEHGNCDTPFCNFKVKK